MPTFLADTVTGGFNVTEVFDVLFSGFEKIIGLFNKFPLNIYLGASLAFLAAGLFVRLRRTAK